MKSLILLSLVGIAFAGCTGTPDTQGDVVEALATSFTGGDLSVSVGDTVTFNMVQASHTVDFAEGDGAVPGVSQAHSGNLDQGDTYTVTFTQPGTYHYFCLYHSSLSGGQRVGMVGTITVTA